MSNTTRFWLTNRFVWMSVITLFWFLFLCSGEDKVHNVIMFIIGFVLYCGIGAYLTENPNPAERLTMRKFISHMENDKGD